MPTQCDPSLIAFAPVVARAAVAPFDGGRMTSEASVMLLAHAGHTIGLTRLLTSYFADPRGKIVAQASGSTATMRQVASTARSARPTPLTVPPVPTPATKASTPNAATISGAPSPMK